MEAAYTVAGRNTKNTVLLYKRHDFFVRFINYSVLMKCIESCYFLVASHGYGGLWYEHIAMSSMPRIIAVLEIQ